MPLVRVRSILSVALLVYVHLIAPATAQQNPQDEANALNQQIVKLYQQGRYADAVPLAQRSLAIWEKALGNEHPSVATLLSNLARLYDNQGRYAEAEPLHKRSLAIREKALGPEHPDVAISLNNLAALYDSQGRYAEAEPLYKRSLAISEKALGPEHPSVATSLNNLAGFYRAQGRYAEAEPLHKRSLAIREKALGPEHPDVATSLNNLAVLYRAQGRYAEAEPLCKRSLAIRLKALGPEHPDVATSLNNLAGLYDSQGRYAEAEPLYKRSLAIDEKAFGPEHPDVAISLNNLAGLYQAQGRHAEAEPLYKRSLAIREKALGPEHPSVAASLNNLAELYRAQGRYAEAEPLYKRSLAIGEKSLGPEHPSVATSLNNLAGLYQSQGRYAEAYASARQAFAILKIRTLASAGQDGSGKEAERQSNRSSFLFFLSVAATQVGNAPDQRDDISIESFAAMQLAGQSSADRALAQASLRFGSANRTLARTVRERQDAIARINTLDKAIVAAASQPPGKREPKRERKIREEFSALGRKLGQIDARLAKEFPEFAELAIPRPLDLNSAQKLLVTDEALLSFTVDRDAIYRFVLRADRSEFRRIEIKYEALAGLISDLRISLDTTGLQDISELRYFPAAKAHDLYNLLVADAVPLLSGAKRLLIVPDLLLGGLPFSVLLTKPPAGNVSGVGLRRLNWLARDYSITVLPSVGSLRALRVFAAKAAAPREPFLGFGDPDLTGRPGDARGKPMARLASRGKVADVGTVRELPPLPDSADELRRIAQALRVDPQETTHLRAAATETRVKSDDLSNYRVLAFATHGLMAGEFAGYGEPALVLTPPAKGNDMDDGLLNASEVAQLKLNADWVILSACNTAAPDGTPGAEGLSGLARAFFYAGSRALLVSHWPVLSDASVRLTTGAIERLAKEPNIGRAEALRQSMLALLDDESLPIEYAHPAIWAPFSLVGEGGAGR